MKNRTKHNIDQLLGNKIDGFGPIYLNHLKSLKKGIKLSADRLISHRTDQTYYSIIKRICDLRGIIINHSIIQPPSKIELIQNKEHYSVKLKKHLFHTEKIKLEFSYKKDRVLLYEGTILKSFKSTPENLFQILSASQNMGSVILTLEETSERRSLFEKSMLEDVSEKLLTKQDEIKIYLQDILEVEKIDRLIKLQLFYPDLTLKTLKSMPQLDIESMIESLRFDTLNIKTEEAFIYFLYNFCKFQVSNDTLIEKTELIDKYFLNYLKK